MKMRVFFAKINPEMNYDQNEFEFVWKKYAPYIYNVQWMEI
jgi:hypothetical protein